MTATATIEVGKLSAKALDAMADRRAELQAELEEISATLKDQVLAHGYTPAKADKTKRLAGERWEFDVCSSDTTEIRDTQVEAIERVTPLEVFSRLFRKVTSYRMQPGASMVLAGTLPQGAPNNLRKLFAQAVILKPKAPSLRVKRIGEEDGSTLATAKR